MKLLPHIFFLFLHILLLPGCAREDHSLTLPHFKAQITGNGFSSFVSPGRAAGLTEFQTGDRILFFCKGGINAEGLILTFDGKNWQADVPIEWEEKGKAYFTAVYPVLERDAGGNYAKEQLYDKERWNLKDILFCQDSCEQNSVIRLKFGHRFSQLNFIVEEGLNSRTAEAGCRSAMIESFDPRTGKIAYASQDIQSSQPNRHDGNVYGFIIAPSAPANTSSVDFSLAMSDQTTHSTRLSSLVFQAGTAYSCSVKMKDNGIGIYTAEDFIAFTYLINGESYNGRKLEEFGETTNGTTVYYLKNDIEFTEEESDRLKTIGGAQLKGKAFKDIFDGQGHTLSHIRLTKKLNGYTNYGIFGETDTTGIIRNLTVEDVSFTQNGNIGYVGLLVGVNRGKIYNCTVKDCTMKAASKSEVDYSGITCSNQGSIINCHADNINITTDKTVNSMAGIAKYNRGNILNCYVTHMKFSGSTGGAHVCYENRDNIQNCYVYGTEGKYNALCYSAINDSYIAYCYYPDTYKKKPVEVEQKPNHEMLLKYDKNCLIKDSNEALHEKMNQWIDEIGKTKYPDFKFTKWTEGENVPATFVTQP